MCLHRPVLSSLLPQGEVPPRLAAGGNIWVQVPWGGRSCVGNPSPPWSSYLCQGCWVPHRWKTSHATLCLYLGVGNLPVGSLPGAAGTVTLSHQWPVPASPQQWGGPVLPWARLWGQKPHVLGPRWPTAAYSYFCCPWKCVYKFFWRWICLCIFIA